MIGVYYRITLPPDEFCRFRVKEMRPYDDIDFTRKGYAVWERIGESFRRRSNK